MSSQVLYRKWRSRTLSELVGQPHVTQTLLNALKSGSISHAYLFCGPRGTGKTSTARILAKAINCLSNNGKGEPCNSCAMCLAITEDRAMDVIEIDAASNRGIDDIRNLREKVNYSPTQARRKVYIIDEFHMLSKDASNALLKTLEEPPPHVIFILATTEAHKVLPTILSRCQHFDFHRLARPDMVAKLTQVCLAEKINIEQQSLNLIARSSTGSLRDAYNLLEQLTTYYGSEIAFSQVQGMLGITGDYRAREILKYIVTNDISRGMATINSVSNDGLDLHQFNRELVDALRGLLLVKTGAPEVMELTAEDIHEFKELADKASLIQILSAVKLFGQIEMGNNDSSTLPLELALVECYLSQEKNTSLAAPPEKVFASPTKAAVANSVASPPAKAAIASPVASPPAKAAITSPVVPPAVKKAVTGGTVAPDLTSVSLPQTSTVAATPAKFETPAKSDVAAAPTPDALPAPIKSVIKDIPATTPSLSSDIERLRLNWKQILDSADAGLKKSNAAAWLKSGSRPVSVEGNSVILSFSYKIHKENLEKPENKRIAEQIISNFLGHTCQITCIYDPKKDILVNKALKMGAQITSVEEK
jgi:DNA polymerase III subunit gamma/tau